MSQYVGDLPNVLSASAFMTELASQVAESISGINLTPLLLYHIDTVPDAVLPLLAEQFSLLDDGWCYAASPSARRQLIKSAIELHRYKGTPWAVRQALTAFGFDGFALFERPEGAHWAEFDVELSMSGRVLSDSSYLDAIRLIDMYKPARSHLRRLTVSVSTTGTIRHAAAVMCGESISIFPYSRRALELRCPAPVLAIGVQSWITTEVRPR